MPEDRPADAGRVLERLVAGVLVIGLLLWGASLLATPDAPGAPDPADAPHHANEEASVVPLPDDDDDDGPHDPDGETSDAPEKEEKKNQKRGHGGD